MWKRKSEADPELADFRYEDKKCKDKFLPDLAILLLQDGRQVILAEKSDVKIESARNPMMSKKFKVELSIEEEKFKTDMKKEGLEKCQAWLQSNQNLHEASA